jgi:hypothetical protein
LLGDTGVRHTRIVLKNLIIIVIVFCISACSPDPVSQPLTKADILSQFQTNELIFLKLRSMLLEDLNSSAVIEIYDDHVLSGDITEERSEEYFNLLKSIPSKRASVIKREDNTIEVEFVIFSSGFVFAGCSTTLTDYNPTKPYWADEYSKIKVKDEWYAATVCG